MPIRAEMRHRYPANWREVRARILARARDCCEWPGCGAANGARIARLESNPEDWQLARDVAFGALTGRYLVTVVLTVAHHPDPSPENCADENLLALCQLHHLRLDGKQHAATAREGRRRRSGQAVLDLEAGE